MKTLPFRVYAAEQLSDLCKDCGEESFEYLLSLVLGDGVLFNGLLALRQWR